MEVKQSASSAQLAIFTKMDSLMNSEATSPDGTSRKRRRENIQDPTVMDALYVHKKFRKHVAKTGGK